MTFPRLPFRTSSMLGAIGVLCVCCCILANRISRLKEEWHTEQAAIASVQANDGRIQTRHVEARWLERFLDDKYLERVDVVELYRGRASSSDKMISESQLLGNLMAFTKLRALHLEGDQFTDSSLKQVGSLKRLETFSCAEANVTGAGFEHLRELTQLEWLTMDNADQMDGKCFRYLEEMPSLKGVLITCRSLPREEAKKFRKRRPDVKVGLGSFTSRFTWESIHSPR